MAKSDTLWSLGIVVLAIGLYKACDDTGNKLDDLEKIAQTALAEVKTLKETVEGLESRVDELESQVSDLEPPSRTAGHRSGRTR